MRTPIRSASSTLEVLIGKGVQGLGRDIGAVGPDHGSADWIDHDSGEEGWIVKGLEDRTLEKGPQIDCLQRVVVELDA